MNSTLKEKLTRICEADIHEFTKLGDTTITEHGPLIHVDRGSKILAVAHLDTVMTAKAEWESEHKIITPMLDDRLGVWVLMNLLPSLGCPNYDILLADSEEIGCSTAQYFEATDRYNWMFEFDRAGTDVVMYEYETDDYEEMLIQEGFKVGCGAFTDICYLEQLGVAGFNFGVGYHRQHSMKCHADVRDTFDMAWHFIEFMKKYQDTKLEHDPNTAGRYRSGFGYDWKSSSQYYNSNRYAAWGLEDEVEGEDEVEIAICPSCYEPCHADAQACSFCGTEITAENILYDVDDEEIERGWNEYLNQFDQA